MALRVESWGPRGNVCGAAGDAAAGWPIRFAERPAGCGARSEPPRSGHDGRLLSGGRLFLSTTNDQLRTGTDKGNPTV